MQKKFYIFISCLFIACGAFAFRTENKFTPTGYIAQFKDAAIAEMQKHNIPASIIMAQAVVESNFGNSKLAINANNHFGIKCHKEWSGPSYTMDDDEKNECFRKYDDIYESYKDHSYFLTSRARYASLFSIPKTDYIAWAKGLKAAGYATHPRYAEMLIEAIELYKLYQLDNEFISPELFAAEENKKEKQEESKTAEFIFKILKFEEERFSIEDPGSSFTEILKDLDRSAGNFIQSSLISVSENSNEEVTSQNDLVVFTHAELNQLYKAHDLKELTEKQKIVVFTNEELKQLYHAHDIPFFVSSSVFENVPVNLLNNDILKNEVYKTNCGLNEISADDLKVNEEEMKTASDAFFKINFIFTP